MYKTFFEHLTTTISQIAAYVNRHPTNRDVPIVKEFQPYLDKLQARLDLKKKVLAQKQGAVAAARSKSKSKSKAKAKGKGKGKARDDDDDEDEEEDQQQQQQKGNDGASPEARGSSSLVRKDEASTPVGRYIARFNLDEGEFVSDLEETLAIMVAVNASVEAEDKRKLRTSKDVKTKILAMSGMSWNSGSKSHVRDWGQLIVAASLEPLIVASYRPQMLAEIHGARVMRKALQEYFVSLGKPNVADFGAPFVVEWSFADGLYDGVGNDPGTIDRLDPNAIRKSLSQARTRGAKVTKKDPVTSFVDMLERNPLLHCSDPDAAPKTMETLASRCISLLAYVSVVSSSARSF